MASKYNIGDVVYLNTSSKTRRGKVSKISPSGQMTVAMDGGGTERLTPEGKIIGGGYGAWAHANAERGERQLDLQRMNSKLLSARLKYRNLGEELMNLWRIAGASDSKGERVIEIGVEVSALGHQIVEFNKQCEKLNEELRNIR